jgi:hypothetical protein
VYASCLFVTPVGTLLSRILDYLVVALMSGSGSVLWGWCFVMTLLAVLLMKSEAKLSCCCVTVCAAVRMMFPLAVHLMAEIQTAGYF